VENNWINLRVEYQIVDAATSTVQIRIYVNDTLLHTIDQENASYLNVDKVQMFTYTNFFGEFLVDNVEFKKVYAADEARPVYDFDGDELPAGVTLGGDFKVNKGQLVANTTIGSVDTATFAPTETEEGDFNTVVWSADINGTPTANQNGNTSEIAFYDEVGNRFAFNIMFRNGIGEAMYFRAITYGCEVTGVRPIEGTEFNVRAEYYLADGAPKVDIYVNGMFAGTITDAKQPIAATDGTKVEFKLGTGESQNVTLDNVRLYKINKTR